MFYAPPLPGPAIIHDLSILIGTTLTRLCYAKQLQFLRTGIPIISTFVRRAAALIWYFIGPFVRLYNLSLCDPRSRPQQFKTNTAVVACLYVEHGRPEIKLLNH